MKILCPKHKEETPSCHIYGERYRCYGCGATGPISELGIKRQGRSIAFLQNPGWDKPEDINKAFERINALPKKLIRGINLHYDDSGYYIVYPNAKYYTKRLNAPTTPSAKYRGPKGHKKPLFVLECVPQSKKTLFVVEGQLNAISIALSFGIDSLTSTVVSPGGASDLNRPEFVQYYLQYDNVAIIVDKDAAGVVAGITLRDSLLAKGKNVLLEAVTTDYNDIYVQDGPETLKEKAMEVLSRLQQQQAGL